MKNNGDNEKTSSHIKTGTDLMSQFRTTNDVSRIPNAGRANGLIRGDVGETLEAKITNLAKHNSNVAIVDYLYSHYKNDVRLLHKQLCSSEDEKILSPHTTLTNYVSRITKRVNDFHE